MELINISEITGFESNDLFIEVLDFAGREFYYFENPNGNRITFNLPPGEYFFTCNAKKLVRALRYVCPELPKPEKKIKVKELKDEDIMFGENIRKASFDNKAGKMFMDNSFKDKTIPQIRLVMGHELGHNYYYTESLCDIYSAKTMLDAGFNPSQCYYANAFCLSDSNGKRKEALYKFLKLVKCYE